MDNFSHDNKCYTKIFDNKHSLNSLNVMANYHYNGKNRVTTGYLPFKLITCVLKYLFTISYPSLTPSMLPSEIPRCTTPGFPSYFPKRVPSSKN